MHLEIKKFKTFVICFIVVFALLSGVWNQLFNISEACLDKWKGGSLSFCQKYSVGDFAA